MNAVGNAQSAQKLQSHPPTPPPHEKLPYVSAFSHRGVSVRSPTRMRLLMHLSSSRGRAGGRLARPALPRVPRFYSRGSRGGLFGSIGKFVKKAVNVVGKVPILSAVAKTVISSVPVLGSVVTAVGAVKAATASGIAATSAPRLSIGAMPGSGPPGIAPLNVRLNAPRKRRKAKKRMKATTRARRRSKPARRGVSAKQRAARARFARAARRGPIRKGQRL